MAQDATQSVVAEEPESEKEGKSIPRDKSTIQFPYLSLEEAMIIAKGVHAVGGNTCQVDQLAAHLNLSPTSGPFRVKLNTTKMFGLITYSSGTISLTALGARICDPQQEQAAKADAFMQIPLYQRVYEQFKGTSLPPPAGLETAMVNMGVAPKQKGTARQIFHRSAQFAGFFWSGPGRLVQPPIKGGTATAPVTTAEPVTTEVEREPERERRKGGSGGDGGEGDYHPFIAGLLKTLPPAESEWSMDARRKWLQAASTIFEVIYKDSDSKGSLRIEVQKDSAK